MPTQNIRPRLLCPILAICTFFFYRRNMSSTSFIVLSILSILSCIYCRTSLGSPSLSPSHLSSLTLSPALAWLSTLYARDPATRRDISSPDRIKKREKPEHSGSFICEHIFPTQSLLGAIGRRLTLNSNRDLFHPNYNLANQCLSRLYFRVFSFIFSIMYR